MNTEARLVFAPKGAIRESARKHDDLDWEEGVPDKLPHECSEIIVVVTTTQPNTGFELEVPEVEDTPGECGLVGEWVVDNSSIDYDPGSFMLDYIVGEARITFRDDGSAKVVYAGFEYRISKDVTLQVGEVSVERHDEFTYTTDAQGETTYEVILDSINFGHGLECDYLQGTQEVHQIRTTMPPIGEQIDEVTTTYLSTFGFFGSGAKFELSGISTLRFLNPNTNEPRVVLNRVSEAQ